jgi:hypothetical protein
MQRIVSMLAVAFLISASTVAARDPAGQQASARSKKDANDHVLHPWALTELIDEIGGRRVTLLKARVIAVLNPRAFLIETASFIGSMRQNLDRVVVLVNDGELRVDTDLVVDSNVKVVGVARTPSSMQITREVPWPPELTKQVLKRYEIRAAVLASSVQTSDGVELTGRLDR